MHWLLFLFFFPFILNILRRNQFSISNNATRVHLFPIKRLNVSSPCFDFSAHHSIIFVLVLHPQIRSESQFSHLDLILQNHSRYIFGIILYRSLISNCSHFCFFILDSIDYPFTCMSDFALLLYSSLELVGLFCSF